MKQAGKDKAMTLTKNQLVVFEDGHKEGYLEARWSDKKQAFYYIPEDENGEKMRDDYGKAIKLYSNTIIEKPARKRKKAEPSEKTCTVKIIPCGETEKAYRLYDGSNGKVSRGNRKDYYKYIAKSICYVNENGEIYAPAWAM